MVLCDIVPDMMLVICFLPCSINYHMMRTKSGWPTLSRRQPQRHITASPTPDQANRFDPWGHLKRNSAANSHPNTPFRVVVLSAGAFKMSAISQKSCRGRGLVITNAELLTLIEHSQDKVDGTSSLTLCNLHIT